MSYTVVKTSLEVIMVIFTSIYGPTAVGLSG